MVRLRSSIEPQEALIADASVIINLVASGCAEQLISAIPNRISVVEDIIGELDRGMANGHEEAVVLRHLTDCNFVDVVALSECDLELYEKLVCGSAAATLDDGEAATLAYCVGSNAIPLIDERKATRICRENYPFLKPASSVDVFLLAAEHPDFGNGRVGTALFNALRYGRMRVMQHQLDWVVAQIGEDLATQCTSLPGHVRILAADVGGRVI